MQLLQQHSGAGDQIMSLQQDPRDDQITVTFEVPGSDDVRKLAATLAKDTLDQFPGTPLVTVRGISGGEIVFVADATRLHLKELQASGAADATSLLQREWPAASASGASQPTTTAAQLSASGTATASTSGSAAPSPQGTDPAAQLGH
jgi:hypothetical protein